MELCMLEVWQIALFIPAQKQTRLAFYQCEEDLGDNGSYTENWFISGKACKENANLFSGGGRGGGIPCRQELEVGL